MQSLQVESDTIAHLSSMFLTKFPLTAKYAKFTARTKSIFVMVSIWSNGITWWGPRQNHSNVVTEVLIAKATSGESQLVWIQNEVTWGSQWARSPPGPKHHRFQFLCKWMVSGLHLCSTFLTSGQLAQYCLTFIHSCTPSLRQRCQPCKATASSSEKLGWGVSLRDASTLS